MVDIDLALPDFLEEPTGTTKRPLRPLQDIDLPQQQEDLELPEELANELALNHPEGHESNRESKFKKKTCSTKIYIFYI